MSQGPCHRRFVLRAATSVLGLPLCANGWAQTGTPLVWVLTPDQTDAYAEALAALRTELSSVTLRSYHPAQTPAPTAGPLPELIVTLGNTAYRTAVDRMLREPALAQVPVVAGLLPRASYEALALRRGAPVTGVWLDPAVERHLDVLRLAMPLRRRVGVLWGPSSRLWRPALQKAAAERNLVLVEAEVPGTELFMALREVLDEADVLLALPDNMVFTPTSLNNVLIAAYRQRVPVLGYAASHVRAGAVLALHATPAQAGRELGQLARRVLQEKRVPPAGPAQLWTVSANEQVAHSLGLAPPDVTALTRALQPRSEVRP